MGRSTSIVDKRVLAASVWLRHTKFGKAAERIPLIS